MGLHEHAARSFSDPPRTGPADRAADNGGARSDAVWACRDRPGLAGRRAYARRIARNSWRRRRRGGWRTCRRLCRIHCRAARLGRRQRCAVVPVTAGSLRTRSCPPRARPDAADCRARRTRHRDSVGDGGGAAHTGRSRGGRRGRDFARCREPAIAAGCGAFGHHRFRLAALVQWWAGEARAQSAERCRDPLARPGIAVAANSRSDANCSSFRDVPAGQARNP